jgi:hypothetical protein
MSELFIHREAAIMKEKKIDQSEFMSMQLMEIEDFRLILSQKAQENITFQEAIMLWISKGYADNFNEEFKFKKDKKEPALA